jgi:hypothetical protein
MKAAVNGPRRRPERWPGRFVGMAVPINGRIKGNTSRSVEFSTHCGDEPSSGRQATQIKTGIGMEAPFLKILAATPALSQVILDPQA